MAKLLKILFSFGLIGIILTGCYRLDIQQGNMLSDEAVQSIHVGMTIDEVVNALGTPVLMNIYRDNKIIYVYTYKVAHHPMSRRRLFIFMSGNRVVQFYVDREPIILPDR